MRAPRRGAPARPLRLLLTGFGPFPGMPVNPTGRIVERIAARGIGAAPPHRLEARVLATEWAALADLERLVARLAPDLVLMTGVAGSAQLVRIERTARNRAGAGLEDAAGALPGEVSLARLPGRIATPLAPRLPDLAGAVSAGGVPARLSDDAGAYLCNASYLVALDAAARLPGRRDVLFVHVPPPRPARGRRPDDLAGAVAAVARRLLAARVQRGS